MAWPLEQAFVLHKNVLSFMQSVYIQLKIPGGEKNTRQPAQKNTSPTGNLMAQVSACAHWNISSIFNLVILIHVSKAQPRLIQFLIKIPR